jgi:NAD(P)-dependent dehydrogenase (short-subunit alcohol dehydrogenase family)
MSEISSFRPDLLAGRVALITGGSSGIGLEIARQLGLHGAKVVISGRRKNVLNSACQDLQQDGVTAHGVQVRIIILLITHIISEASKPNTNLVKSFISKHIVHGGNCWEDILRLNL